MAETLREDRLFGEGKHRADEILVHHRSWWQSAGPLLGILGLLVLGLIALWAYRRNQLPEVTMPKLETPNLEKPSLPAVPGLPNMTEPAAPAEEVGNVAPPTPPAEPTPAPVAAPPVGTNEEACSKETVFHFTTNATELRATELASVEPLAECLKANPEKKVRLEGRADVRGEDDHNRELALGRAQTIKAKLTTLGVPASQVSVVVRPASCPEANEGCWQQDRSVTATQE